MSLNAQIPLPEWALLNATRYAIGRMTDGLRKHKISNPTILLDSGKKVWGCECWWGPEESVQKRLDAWIAAGAILEEIDIDVARDRAAAAPVEGQT